MPKRGIAALAVTVVALVMLLTFKTPDVAVGTRTGSAAVAGPTSPTATPRAASGSSTMPTATPTPTTVTGGTTGTTTVAGPTVSTRFGPVQVEAIVSAGKVVDVVAVQLPAGGHSGRISTASAPILRSEALQAQSASIEIVSGATYTSEAYAQSLQGALDQAGIS